MPADDRDAKFERALEQHLRAGSAQAGCPDAEMLAAYHERSLSLEEMAHWKQHISGCAACQEALALVEATENQLVEEWQEQGIPVVEAASMAEPRFGKVTSRRAAASAEPASPVAIGRGRRTLLMRWAVPLGAVAAGVLIWIGIHEQRALQSPGSKSIEVAQNGPVPAPEQKMNEAAPKAEPPAERDARQMPLEPEARRKDLPMNGRNVQPPIRMAPSASGDALVNDSGLAKKESVDHLAGAVPAMTPAPPSPKVPAQTETVTVEARNEAAEVAAAPRAPAPAPAAQPSAPMAYGNAVGGTAGAAPASADAKTASRTAKEKAAGPAEARTKLDAATSAMMMKQGVSSQSVEVSASGAGLVLTPDNKAWWKLGLAGTVELTTDSGKKWKSLNTGTSNELTAGSAPSARVCWIAGKAGTLVLTTDRGGHWNKISTPISGDLGGVHAVDAMHASIWDAANRQSYETSDGGATWKQTANE